MGDAKNPWDAPRFPTFGDDDANLTFAAVGRALSLWEEMEVYLAYIFGALVGDDNEIGPAIRAIGSLNGFGTKISLIKEAAQAYFTVYQHELINDEINSLVKRSQDLSGRRNEIAHGIVQPYYAPNRRGFVLAPSKLATKKRRLVRQAGEFPFHVQTAYAYSSKEIDEVAKGFKLLSTSARYAYKSLFTMNRERLGHQH